MAGDWIKVEKLTPDKPEMAILARKLGVSMGEAFMNWFRVYAWADGVTCPGFVPNLSPADVDALSRARPGTCQALCSVEIAWMQLRSDGVAFNNWDRHNGKSAKARALETEKKRKQRGKAAPESTDLSRSCPATNGTESGPEQEETRGEPIALRANGKAIGNSPVAPIAGPVASRLPRKNFVREGFTPDLSAVDWGRVVIHATIVGKKIKPKTDPDRRNFFRYAVLAQTTFCEAWLMDAVEAVLHAKERKSNMRAHLYGVLRSKAIEEGFERRQFAGLLRCIEIPDDVWQQSVLEVPK